MHDMAIELLALLFELPPGKSASLTFIRFFILLLQKNA